MNMKFWGKLHGESRKRRVVVIGLDGTPHTLLQRLLAEGRMPELARIVAEGELRQMDSIWPWVSSVAWASYMTGRNPAKHGIYGFIDRDPTTYKTYIPTSHHMKADTLWEILSRAGKRVIVINVPVTYPPRPVNGILIGCFLSPSVDKCAYPSTLVPLLKELGYRVDTDPWLARRSKEEMLADVSDALTRRVRTMFYLMDNEPWDFFQCHIMETDRLHHFLWEQMANGDPVYAPRFYEIYSQIDQTLGEVRRRLDDRTTLIILSDHGFTTIKKEVYVNHWLAEQGWLRYNHVPPERDKGLLEIHPCSVAYSMDPGRVFIRVHGREKDGPVPSGEPYERLRQEIAEAALALRDPDSGEPLFRQAFRREELYHGPLLEQAADLILAPADGYDPKGTLYKEQFTFKGPELVGMHTYDDASFFIRGYQTSVPRFCIMDVMPTILKLMDVPLPGDLDGRPVV